MSAFHATDARQRRAKVCVIADACTKADAISAAIAADCRALLRSGEFEPFLLSEMCQIAIPHANIRGLEELIYHPRFVDADIRLFHFGFYSELFNACLLGKGRVKRVLRFHNVTPAEFVDPSQRERIEKARRQVAVVAKADEIWPISPFNGRTLAQMGFAVDPRKTLTIPIAPLTKRLDPWSKQGPITILYVGRIVPAKGVHLLLDAFELVTARGHTDVELILIGSPYIHGYASKVRSRIGRGRLTNARLLGRVSQARLARAYERASIVAIPSFHEGLCVPVIEALAAGAIPVVSNAAALPETLNGLGRLTPVGDPVALADCLEEVIADIRGVRRDPDNARIKVERGTLAPNEYYAAISRHLEMFSPTKFGAELISRLRALSPPFSPSA